MSGIFVNKATADREKLFFGNKKIVQLLRYTGDDLVTRDTRKFRDTVYKNFEQLDTSPDLNHNRRGITELLTSPDSIILLGVIDGVITSYLIAKMTVIDNLKQLMHIYYLYTSPMHRGNGLATHMLNMIQKYSKERNITTISLTFDTYDKQLERFYMNNHFVYDSNLRSYERHDMLVKYI
jgi:ribosomal protein S18 acetylase RimI-like enzyme